MRLYSPKKHCVVPISIVGDNIFPVGVLQSSAKRLVYYIMLEYKLQEFRDYLFARTGMVVSRKFAEDNLM